MSLAFIVISVYASLIFLGGLIGYLQAASMISLMTGCLFALALFFSAIAMGKKKKIGYSSAFSLTLLLTLFFLYRLVKTGKVMPAGMMFMISAAVVLILLFDYKKNLAAG